MDWGRWSIALLLALLLHLLLWWQLPHLLPPQGERGSAQTGVTLRLAARSAPSSSEMASEPRQTVVEQIVLKPEREPEAERESKAESEPKPEPEPKPKPEPEPEPEPKPQPKPEPTSASEPELIPSTPEPLPLASSALPAAPTAIPSTSTPRTTGRELAAAANDAAPNYHATLLAHLQPFQNYPPLARRRGQQGEVMLQLRIECDGAVSALSSGGSAPSPLQRAAQQMVRDAEPLPPPPLPLGCPYQVPPLPIVYRLIR